MRNVAKTVLALAAFGTAAWIGVEFIAPALYERNELPLTPEALRLPDDLIRRIAKANNDEVGPLLRDAFEE